MQIDPPSLHSFRLPLGIVLPVVAAPRVQEDEQRSRLLTSFRRSPIQNRLLLIVERTPDFDFRQLRQRCGRLRLSRCSLRENQNGKNDQRLQNRHTETLQNTLQKVTGINRSSCRRINYVDVGCSVLFCRASCRVTDSIKSVADSSISSTNRLITLEK